MPRTTTNSIQQASKSAFTVLLTYSRRKWALSDPYPLTHKILMYSAAFPTYSLVRTPLFPRQAKFDDTIRAVLLRTRHDND